jgi:TolA-binding protein
MMRRKARQTSTAALCVAMAVYACQAYADTSRQETIKSLESRSVELRPGKLIVGSSTLARDNYREFLDLVSDDPDLRAEAMRRLADLELEASEANELADNIGALRESSYEGAVSLFQALLDTYPDYRRNDTVLYQLARAHEISGRTDDALQVLNELVARHPDTAMLDEVEFRRGEMLFLRKQYAAAEDAYGSVVSIGERSKFYEQSLYKLGWSRFKLALHEESLDPFFALLDRKVADVELQDGDQRLAALSRAEQELVEDTFRVLSISFSYMEGPDSIHAYLSERGYPSYGYIIFMNLGDLYLEKERFVDAAQAYEAFVAENPDHPKSPLLQIDVIEAYKRGSFPTLVLQGKKDFVERYGMDRSFWKENPRESNQAVAAHLKDNLTDLAQYYHAEAQKSSRPADYQEAARWYRDYLDYFPMEADSANTNFLLAEILFESKDFAAAVDEYERTAYEYPRHEHSGEAAYAALLAYREHELEVEEAGREAWHQRYLDSGLRFADAHPEHPESGAVLTTVAEDLFRRDQFDLATLVAQSAVAKVPPVGTSLARTAWTVIAHSQFDLQHFSQAESAYHELRAYIPSDEPEAHREVQERIASSIYKQGELARDSGDLETAVTHFSRVGQAVPDSAIRATADYDAAAVLINMAAWGRASTVLEDFRRNHPDSEYANDITQKLAVTYLAAGRGSEAAAEFENIAAGPDATEEVRREALWKASELYRESNETRAEQRALENIVAQYPDPLSESIEARHRLLLIAESSGDQALRERRLRDLVNADATAGNQRSDRTRYLAAKASLELAEPLRLSFAAFKLSQPLAGNMKVKKSLMEDVLKAYGDASDYGVAEVTTAATFRLGQVYQQFSKDLMESERPADLDAAALEQYDLLLEEQVFPFEEKSIELFKVNAARAADGIYDEWISRSFEALAELMPARYAKTEIGEDVFAALY